MSYKHHGTMKNPLSHTDQEGKARMVDVGGKAYQKRIAEASGLIRLSPGTLQAIRDNQLKKGDVLCVAQIAGIQAAKSCSGLIPLCHPLSLDHVQVEFELLKAGIRAWCRVGCTAKTGVEMEALTGVSLALLTIYDMCKSMEKEMLIEEIRLVKKEKEEISE